MENNFKWITRNLLVKEFRSWVLAQGSVAPSYEIMRRAEDRITMGGQLTRRQEHIAQLASSFRLQKAVAAFDAAVAN